jgi:hypothetical protein
MFDLYQVCNFLLINTRDDSLGAVKWPYLIFNAGGAVCWLGVAVAILRRHLKFRKSKSEVGYMLAFMAFGLSDFIETSGTTLLLLLFKGACLLAILACRKSIRPLYQNPAF